MAEFLYSHVAIVIAPFFVVAAVCLGLYALFFGLIRDYKGLDLLLRAWAQLRDAGIGADLIRLSCGLENSADLIADLAQAIDAV